jgi:hypothetical protein
MGAPLTAPEQHIAECYLEPMRAVLPDARRREASDEGAAMTLDEAVAYALERLTIRVRATDAVRARPSPAAQARQGGASPPRDL